MNQFEIDMTMDERVLVGKMKNLTLHMENENNPDRIREMEADREILKIQLLDDIRKWDEDIKIQIITKDAEKKSSIDYMKSIGLKF
jgi:hypothetical protein